MAPSSAELAAGAGGAGAGGAGGAGAGVAHRYATFLLR